MKMLRPLLIAALMFTHLPAHATSFDCTKGRSLTERMICNDPGLSKLDDTLGQLYWKARRRVVNRRAFLTDSDSKWAWREANCRDETCLGTWYASRIDELKRLIQAMQTGTPARTVDGTSAVTPADPDEARKTPLPAPALQQLETAMLQCTASNPGIELHDQCSTVIKQKSQWEYKPHGGDWFCGLAMLDAPQ
ncbi:lysozyme inhibitor LprI family protein [Paraburkholderia sp. GAS199]|uniref:lysozyme inhibitor LprI family protein n=1 Tax=Paraburkholderia sp. GAS199 TaxID=3035126 RepID=UPI003D1DB14D